MSEAAVGAPGRRRFVRFLVVGASNTALSFATFAVLVKVVPPLPRRLVLVQLLAYAAGVAWSYYWNRRWSFRQESRARGELVRYAGVQIAIAVTSGIAIDAAVARLGWTPRVAWFFVMGASTVANYLLLQSWVFRPDRGSPA